MKEKIVATKELENELSDETIKDLVYSNNKLTTLEFISNIVENDNPFREEFMISNIKKRENDMVIRHEFNLIYKGNILIAIDFLFAMQFKSSKKVRYYIKPLFRNE